MRIDSRDVGNTPITTKDAKKPQIRTDVEAARRGSGSLRAVELTGQLVKALADQLS